jgi:tripartite-type tricarboxylate transporter receptor subunit TctC
MPIITAPGITDQRMPKRSAMRPIMMPPAAEPSQTSELASAGTERASPISAAMDFNATAVIHGAPNDMPSSSNEMLATTQEERVSMDRGVSILCVVKPIPGGLTRRDMWRRAADLLLCSQDQGGMEMRKQAIALALAAACAAISSAAAQNFPSKPISVIVPFAAGGPSDVLARTLAERMRVPLGQPLIVENVAGAAGTIGVARVVRAPADGYTISFGHLGTHVINGAIYPLSFDLLNDLDPIGLIGANPMLVVSKNAVPVKSLKDLIAWLKANDGKATLGTAGVGSGSHFSGVYFQSLIGTRAQYVPYRGTGPAMQDLVAGRIDIIVDQAANSMPQVQGGKIRAYAVAADKRLAAAPDIPTVEEAGLPGFHVLLWSGLWVPKGTPKEIVVKLNAALMDALTNATVLKLFGELGLDVSPRDRQSPEALRAYQKAEADKWWPLIKAANIKPEG